MAHAAVQADLDEALDVQRHLATEVALDLVATVDELAEAVDLLLREVADPRVGVDVRLGRIFWVVRRPIPKMYVRAISTRFSRGMSTPAMRAIDYPCRCLCLGWCR